MNFSEQIKNIRNSKGMTQEQLAERLSVSRQTISGWENGRNLPDLEMVVSIAEQFDLSLDELILGGNDMTKKLIRDGSETRRARMNMISVIIGAVLLCGGVTCLIIKALSVEYVDDNGFLHEKFFLLPVGFLLILSGLVTFVTTGLANAINAILGRRKGKSVH